MEMEKELYLKENFLRILADGADLNKLCDFVAKCIHTPVALTLTTRTIIAKSTDYVPDLVDEYVSSLYLCSEEEVKELDQRVQSLLRKKTPVVELYPYLKHRRIDLGCFRGNTMVAVLDCPIVTRALPEDAPEIIATAAPIFVIAMQMHDLITPTALDTMQIYLSKILHGEDLDHYQQMNLHDSPLEKVRSWQIIWCAPRRPEDLAELHSIAADLCVRNTKIWYLEYESGIVFLQDSSKTGHLEKLASACQDIGILTVSEPYPVINQTAEQVRIAQAAARIAAFEDNKETLIFVRDYKLHIYFLSYIQNKQIDLQDPVIDRIKKYDAEHDSEYFLTLRAYLFYKRDTQEMARRLHVHKNTITYRMQRICDLFVLDLKDCRTIASLYLSLFLDISER